MFCWWGEGFQFLFWEREIGDAVGPLDVDVGKGAFHVMNTGLSCLVFHVLERGVAVRVHEEVHENGVAWLRGGEELVGAQRRGLLMGEGSVERGRAIG
jgi:hypothetical protein